MKNTADKFKLNTEVILPDGRVGKIIDRDFGGYCDVELSDGNYQVHHFSDLETK